MRKLLPILASLLLLNSVLVSAQTLTGKVVDESKAALPGAAIILLSWPDSVLIKGEISDLDGTFSLIVPEKSKGRDMRLRIQGLSLMPRMLTLPKNGQETMDFGTIAMSARTANMGEVVVQAAKPIFEVDPEKLTFNVAQSTTTQGQTALEVLRKAPGVYVDRNDNITLKGKPGPRIYINGRPSPLQGKDLANYLNSLSSNDIEKIDLISYPGARYEAQGAGGIIDIRLKQNKSLGFNGTVNGTLAQGSTTYQRGYYLPRHSLSVNLNYRKGKLGMSGGVSRFRPRNVNDQRHFRISRAPGGPDPAVRVDTAYDPIPTVAVSTTLGHMANFNLDYAFNKRHSAGFNLNAGHNDMTWVSNSRTRIVPLSQQVVNGQEVDVYGDTARILAANSSMHNLNRNGTGAFWYRFQDDSGRTLDADISSSVHSIRQNNYVSNEYLMPRMVDGQRNDLLLYDVNFQMLQPSTLHLSVAKVDYNTPILKHTPFSGNLGVGARMNWVKTDNTFAYQSDRDTTRRVDDLQTDVQRSNQFLYTERVSAGYITYGFSYKKLKFSAGLRAEHTYTKRDLYTAQDIPDSVAHRTRQYLNLFPSGGISWTINPKHTLSLNYSKRIDRPNYGQLNPFEIKLDELTYQKGNPNLSPQYIHNVELQHTFMGMINTSVGYSHSDSLYAEIIGTDASGRRNFITPKNLAKRDLFSFNLASPFRFGKVWSGYFTAQAYYDMYGGRVGGYRRDTTVTAKAWSMYMQNTFQLPRGFSFEVSGYYNSPNIWAGTFRNSQFGGVDVGLRRRFDEGRATVSFTVSDIFFTNRWRGISNYNGTYMDSRGGWDSRIFRLTVNYTFGNTKIRAQRRQSAIEDLNNRAGGGGGGR